MTLYNVDQYCGMSLGQSQRLYYDCLPFFDELIPSKFKTSLELILLRAEVDEVLARSTSQYGHLSEHSPLPDVSIIEKNKSMP